MPRRALVGVFGGLFCGYLALAAVIPVLPGFVRERYGASDLTVGLVVTGTALTALLARPVSGHLADRYGHRPVMRLGALVIAAGGLLYFLPLGLSWLVGVRLLLGVGEASLFTAGAVWTVSLAPHDRRGQLIGLYGLSMWGGISAGTLLGAVLVHAGHGAVWAFSTVAPLAGLLLISSVSVPSGARRPGGGAGLALRPAALPGLSLGLASAGYAGLAAFVVLHLEARGIRGGVVVLSCFSAVYAGVRLFVGHLPDVLGPRRVAAWSGAGEAAGLTIIALAPNLPVAVAGSVVMGAGFSLLHPSLALLVMDRADPSRQGAALGAYTSFWDLGLSIWGPAVGAVAAGFGYPAVFVAGAVCAAAAVSVALCVRTPGARAAAVEAAAARSSRDDSMDTPLTTPLTILCITGWCRNGSTIIGNVLNEVPGFFHVGELHFLWKNAAGRGSNTSCGCGRKLTECGIWSEILSIGRPAGMSAQEHAETVVRRQLSSVRTRHTWRVLRRGLHPGDIREHAELMTRVYHGIAERTGARVLVDTTKIPGEAALLSYLDGVRPYFVHLVRDPRAVAQSWSREKEYCFVMPARTSTAYWLGFNLATHAITRRHPDRSMFLRYEEFIADPAGTIDALLRFCGADPAANPVRGQVVELGVNHTVTGNPDRFRTGRTVIRDGDEAWRAGLPGLAKLAAVTLSEPLFHRYGYRLRGTFRARSRPVEAAPPQAAGER